MLFAVARQVTPAAEGSQLLEVQPPRTVRLNDGQIEIDEVGVVHGIALRHADAVGVVACGAWSFFVYDMLLVLLVTPGTEGARPAAAGVAERIGRGALREIVGRRVILRQEAGGGPAVWA